MRAIFTVGLSFLLAAAGVMSTAPASAQDDFDEFEEDEFEDEFGEGEEGGGEEGGGQAEEGGEQAGDGEEAAEEPAAGARTDDDLWNQRYRQHNSWFGPTGGLRVVDANPAAVDSWRVQLATEFFFASDYLVRGDQNDHIGGTLSLSWTPHRLFEIYASLSSYANANTEEDPELFQVLGDTVLGVKAGYAATPFLTIGGDLGLYLLNTVGDIGLVLGSTSFGIRGNLTADLRGLANPVPFIARFNVQYYFDNSSGLVEDVEDERYANLEDPRRRRDEDRHLITRVERYALNINRTDRFNFSLGIEAPLQAATDLYIHPILEWTLGVPVNRQGYNCLVIPGDDGDIGEGDACLDREGFSAFPMSLTLGVRVLPPVKGLSMFAGVDIGLTGTSTNVRELAANDPYMILLGASYAYDLRPPPPPPEPVVREVERQVEVRIPPPPRGRLVGVVLEDGTNAPVGGAIIRFPGRDLTALVASDDGRFTTYELDPGEVQLEVSHPEYNPGTCAGTIAAEGGDVEVRCTMTALPRMGNVRGQVNSSEGIAVIATVNISGPATRSVTADASGSFQLADLPPGTYTARVEADAFLIKQQQFEVRARETTQVNITLVPRPRRSLVQVRRREITIRRQINFVTDSAEIQATSEPLMAEIADVILRNPQLTRIEIQGHTDDRGGAAHNMTLSQSRAESVRTWLIGAGIAPERLEARGYGMTQPLVPNITAANRARNRRVQFIIRDQGDAAGAGGEGGGGGGGGGGNE